MKLLTFLIAIALGGFAHAGGELVSSLHYIDDSPNFKLSPYLGVKIDESIDKVELLVESGGGYLDQGSSANSTYARAGLDAFYTLPSQWKIGAGLGLETNPSAFKVFDDYVHVTASYKLW